MQFAIQQQALYRPYCENTKNRMSDDFRDPSSSAGHVLNRSTRAAELSDHPHGGDARQGRAHGVRFWTFFLRSTMLDCRISMNLLAESSSIIFASVSSADFKASPAMAGKSRRF